MKSNQEHATEETYATYKKIDWWHVHKAVSLAVGHKPDESANLRGPQDILRKITDATLRAKWDKFYPVVKYAMIPGTPKRLIYREGLTACKWLGLRLVRPSVFIQWAKKRKISLPGPIGGDAGSKQETPAQRRARVKRLIAAEKVKGTKAFFKTVADNESVSETRLRQWISDPKTTGTPKVRHVRF